MEQARKESQQQQEQRPNPLRCPRCGSLDTRFRYFNNGDLAQPRHYCRTCKRQWTVGGNLRHVPIGGRHRNGMPKDASSSIGENPISQPLQPPLPLRVGHQQNTQSPTPMAGTTTVSQLFDMTMFQSVTTLPAAVSPWNYFNDEISYLDAVQSMIQPEINNQHVNAGDLFTSADSNMTISHQWDVQFMSSDQAIPQENHTNSNQTRSEAINAPPSHLYMNSVVQPAWPINLLSRDITNDFRFTTPNDRVGNNFSGDTTNTEDTTSVNVDEWLNFSDSDPQ
ncbi:hypothetical protein C2S51_013001 [Perilla frutescens var. frutescens]|nr:hypothetical protein C2S51_013001 [Perilla frutescens var. frutescens]